MWAHRLMQHVETNQMIGEAQGGGRPHRTANDVALRKMLTYTYARASRTNFGFMDLDATSCYDRIIAGLPCCAADFMVCLQTLANYMA